MSDAESWNQRYAEGTDKWTLDAPPRVISAILAGRFGESAPAPGRVLVPGAGTGADAQAWARGGHEVVAIDFAELAVRAMQERSAQLEHPFVARREDVFALPEDLRGVFDFVWEQTCFCAIDPEQRSAYVASMTAALKPGGALIGLFWNHGNEGGPPYDMTRETVEQHFAGAFEMGESHWLGELQNREREWLVRMRLPHETA